MLKTTGSPDVLGHEVGNGDGEVIRFDVGDGEEFAKKLGKSKGQNLSKSRKLAKSRKNLLKNGHSPNFGATETGPSFLTLGARKAFNCLQLAFTKAPILWHFDPEWHIWIETDILGYAINSVLSQLAFETRADVIVTKSDLGKWYLVAFFLRKMIPAEIQYKTHNDELLAIVKAFKTWRHYLKSCKY